MDWSVIKKDEMLQAISVLDLVPQRAGIPSSDYVRVLSDSRSLEMALSSSVSGVVSLKMDGAKADKNMMFVDRRLFIPFIQMGRGWKGDFKFSVSEQKWVVRQGSRQAEFALKKDTVLGYPVFKSLKDLKEIKLSENLRKLLLASNQCATADPSLQHLNCVYIGGKTVMATNLAVMFVGARDKEDSMRFAFPVGVIPLLGDGLVLGVGVENDKVILDCGCGYIEGMVSAVAKKDFPRDSILSNVKKGRDWPTLLRLPAEKLAKMLVRLSEYLASVKREDWVVRLDVSGGKVKATVRVQQGKFEESIDIEDSKAEGVIEWPLEIVHPVLSYIAENGETVKVKVDDRKKTPYLISGGGVEMMIGRRLR